MSHTVGHVEEEASSCGIIRMHETDNSGTAPGLFFVPSSWKPRKNQKVGFHTVMIPIDDENSIPVAYDVIPWENHIAAEASFKDHNPDLFKGNNKLEQVMENCHKNGNYTDEGARILYLIKKEGQREQEVLYQTLAYMATAEGKALLKTEDAKDDCEKVEGIISKKLPPLSELRRRKGIPEPVISGNGSHG